MDARTQKSELTRAAIVGAALDLASSDGLEAITLQAVADRIDLSKSGVFSRVGSREALQKAVVEEFGSTTVVFPGQHLEVDAHGILIVRPAPRMAEAAS